VVRARQRAARLGRRNPAQVVSLAFTVALLVGTALLMLPPARSGPGGAPFVTALFTSASAVCVVGLGLVDTATYWSPLGQGIIVALVQVGGFGIIVGASLVGIVVSRRLGLRTRLTAQAETRALDLADVRRVVIGVAVITVVVEAATALVLTLRLALHYGEPAGLAAWHGVFLAVTSYNNAGFAPYSDNLMGFVSDPVICLPIGFAVIIGGIGFPVLFELAREWRQPRTWSVHTRTTLIVTAVLLLGGWAFLTTAEWGNPGTFGPLSAGGKTLAGFFHSVQPRTAGFNTVDYAQMQPESILLTQVLMFIGGGSGSTAGGIRVTTLAVLAFAVRAEVRGSRDVNAFNRRLPMSAVRQAAVITVVTGAIALTGTGALLLASDLPFTEASFEIISALGTVGLSLNVTAGLTGLAPLVVTAVMFVGRLGPVTLGAALALRETQSLYRLPEERTIVG
jgi:Trk-type K+ transport system membrane component